MAATEKWTNLQTESAFNLPKYHRENHLFYRKIILLVGEYITSNVTLIIICSFSLIALNFGLITLIGRCAEFFRHCSQLYQIQVNTVAFVLEVAPIGDNFYELFETFKGHVF